MTDVQVCPTPEVSVRRTLIVLALAALAAAGVSAAHAESRASSWSAGVSSTASSWS